MDYTGVLWCPQVFTEGGCGSFVGEPKTGIVEVVSCFKGVHIESRLSIAVQQDKGEK